MFIKKGTVEQHAFDTWSHVIFTTIMRLRKIKFFRSQIKSLAELGVSLGFLTLASLQHWLPPLSIWLGCWILTSHSAYTGPDVSPGLFSMKWLGRWLRNGDKQAGNATIMVCPKYCGSRKEWMTNLEKAFREAGIWSCRLSRSISSRGWRGGHCQWGKKAKGTGVSGSAVHCSWWKVERLTRGDASWRGHAGEMAVPLLGRRCSHVGQATGIG